jgi:hypothetical protein
MYMETQETEEQKAARLESEKQAKAAQREADKAAKAQAREQGKAAKAAEREQAKAAKEAEKAAKLKAKEEAAAAKKAEQEAAKAAEKQPEQNGIRRPKPEGMCGRAWAIFDEASKARGEPASIGETLPVAVAAGINDATVRTQYARWRKFHNVSGRIEAPKPVQEPAAEPAPVAPAPEVPPAPPAA